MLWLYENRLIRYLTPAIYILTTRWRQILQTAFHLVMEFGVWYVTDENVIIACLLISSALNIAITMTITIDNNHNN